MAKDFLKELQEAETTLQAALKLEEELKAEIERLLLLKARKEFSGERFQFGTELVDLRSRYPEAQKITKAHRERAVNLRVEIFGEELKRAQEKQLEITSAGKVESEQAFNALRQAMVHRARLFALAEQEDDFVRDVNRQLAEKGLPQLHVRLRGCLGNLAPALVNVDLVEMFARKFRDSLLTPEYDAFK